MLAVAVSASQRIFVASWQLSAKDGGENLTQGLKSRPRRNYMEYVLARW